MINSMQIAVIWKDIRSITANRNLFLALLIVPLVMTVILPSVLVFTIGLAPLDSADIEQILVMLTEEMTSSGQREAVLRLLLNNVMPLFFLMIPIMAASVMAASSFVGEKEKRTLETLLYCPLSLQQVFNAKIIASFALSQFVSLVSFTAMTLVVQTELLFIIGTLILPGLNWLVLLLLVAPAMSLIAITLIVRSSAKSKSMEESQQRSVFLILPLIFLAVGQFSGVVMVSAWLLFAIGVLCAIFGLILLRRSSANIHYERLLQ